MKLISVLFATFLSSVTFAVNPIDNLPKAVAQKHLALTRGECQKQLNKKSEIFDLGFGYKLYLVPCIMGAYQGTSRAYIQDKYRTVSQIVVLAYNDYFKSIVGSLDLGEPTFDIETKTLSTLSKYRGLGDCGQSSQSKFLISEDSYSVKTVEIRQKSECDLSDDIWPVIFSQK